jgi:hypothetical protein
MARLAWAEWEIVQLQECLMRGIAPEETAALLGKTKEDVYAKAHELGLLVPPSYEESPSTAPEEPVLFPRNIAAS